MNMIDKLKGEIKKKQENGKGKWRGKMKKIN